jgi:protein involved in temperature-dependent protein secretion
MFFLFQKTNTAHQRCLELRREAKRHAAFASKLQPPSAASPRPKAVSPLRSATAVQDHCGFRVPN